MSVTTSTDVERVQELVGALHGRQLEELEAALVENREGVLRLAMEISRNAKLHCPPVVLLTALRKGEHKRKVKRMSDELGKGHARQLVPASEAFRRLYDAKLGELQRYRLPEGQRVGIAMDYACGEIGRCHIEPMPPGGVVKLEDDLYRELGIDRVTGLHYPPQTRA